MKRREFITLFGLVQVGLSLAAQAEQAERIRHLGVLMSTKQDDPLAQSRVAAFREGLKQLGWSEGRSLVIEWRSVSVHKLKLNDARFASHGNNDAG